MIVTRGYGDYNQIVTRGYRKLIIVVSQAGGYAFRPEPGIIQTRSIKLPGYKKKILVDVLLISKEDLEKIDVIVKKWQVKYNDVKVYLEKDVEYDQPET